MSNKEKSIYIMLMEKFIMSHLKKLIDSNYKFVVKLILKLSWFYMKSMD